MLVMGLLVACGGAHTTATDPRSGADQEGRMRMEATKLPADPESRFGPLEVGADYLTYRKVTDRPFQSLDHGNRWVDVYVNAIGAAAYLSGEPVPIGTIVVKTSWQDDHGKPSDVVGPLFIMEKRAPGYAPEHDDWYFAIHWANPPAADARKLGGPIYWRGKSQRAAYCWECHDLYDRRLGGLTPSSQLPR
jgi:Cytochrome P460